MDMISPRTISMPPVMSEHAYLDAFRMNEIEGVFIHFEAALVAAADAPATTEIVFTTIGTAVGPIAITLAIGRLNLATAGIPAAAAITVAAAGTLIGPTAITCTFC